QILVIESSGYEEKSGLRIERDCVRSNTGGEVLDLVSHSQAKQGGLDATSGAAARGSAAHREVQTLAGSVGVGGRQHRDPEPLGQVGDSGRTVAVDVAGADVRVAVAEDVDAIVRGGGD